MQVIVWYNKTKKGEIIVSKFVAMFLMYNGMSILFVRAVAGISFDIDWILFDLAELFVGTVVYAAYIIRDKEK